MIQSSISLAATDQKLSFPFYAFPAEPLHVCSGRVLCCSTVFSCPVHRTNSNSTSFIRHCSNSCGSVVLGFYAAGGAICVSVCVCVCAHPVCVMIAFKSTFACLLFMLLLLLLLLSLACTCSCFIFHFLYKPHKPTSCSQHGHCRQESSSQFL